MKSGAHIVSFMELGRGDTGEDGGSLGSDGYGYSSSGLLVSSLAERINKKPQERSE